MVDRAQLTLKVLISRFHKEDESLFLNALPDEEKDSVQKLDIEGNTLEGLNLEGEKVVSSIHYSWVLPVIKKLSKQEKEWALSSLPPAYSKALEALIQEDQLNLKNLTPIGRKFLINFLLKELQPKEILPVAYLKPTPMLILLKLDKNSLLELIDFLGLYDLAEKIRSVVDKKKLSSIYRALSAKEQKFLSYSLRSGDKTFFTDLDLSKWDGNGPKLKSLLHKKGLLRLAKAISEESPDFLWHLFHRLDTGRAAFLEKNLLPKPNEMVQAKLKDQILHILNIITPRGT